MSGPHFRDYHLLLDEQADQIFAARQLFSCAATYFSAQSLKVMSRASLSREYLEARVTKTKTLDVANYLLSWRLLYHGGHQPTQWQERLANRTPSEHDHGKKAGAASQQTFV